MCASKEMDQVRLEHLVNQFYDDTGNIFPVKIVFGTCGLAIGRVDEC